MLFYYFYTIVSGRWQEVFMNESQVKEWFTNLRHELTGDVIDQEKALNAFDHLRAAYNNLPSNPTFKFAIGQEVWFLKDDKVRSASVRVRQITESSERLQDERNNFSRSTNDTVFLVYSFNESKTVDVNWQLAESSLFASKAELLESL
jgi:hypothetical protein